MVVIRNPTCPIVNKVKQRDSREHTVVKQGTMMMRTHPLLLFRRLQPIKDDDVSAKEMMIMMISFASSSSSSLLLFDTLLYCYIVNNKSKVLITTTVMDLLYMYCIVSSVLIDVVV